MLRIKLFLSIIVFSFLLIFTSFIKNQTRDIEKKINKISKTINFKEKDLNESELDFSYLTSPSIIEKKLEHVDNKEYFPMEHSKIFLSMSDFININNKVATQDGINEKAKEKQKF